jgi:hypothetical protein
MQRRIVMAALAGVILLAGRRTLQAQAGKPLFTSEELDQMLAPIALYPDSLLSQVLMAATYPLEVVEAARWSRANPNLKADAAVAAVQDRDWDISVKSLAAFPQVLAQMDDRLDWTQKIGDAMLAQEKDVGDSVQRLRARAADAGNLANTAQERIEYLGAGPDRTIVIEPADPAMIYVPYYNPVWAYGVWPYAAYPPYYYPPLPMYGYGAVLVSGFMFGIGLAAAGALFGGWHWGRGASYINVNVNRAVHIDRNFSAARTNNGAWQHDPEHRRGVAYRDIPTQQHFGQARPGIDQRQQYRGRSESAPSGGQAGGQRPQANLRQNMPAQGPTQGSIQRPNVGSAQPRPQVQSRPGGTPQIQRGGAISGVERGGQVNRESARGNVQQQRSSAPAPQPRSSGGGGGGAPRPPAGGGGKR